MSCNEDGLVGGGGNHRVFTKQKVFFCWVSLLALSVLNALRTFPFLMHAHSLL